MPMCCCPPLACPWPPPVEFRLQFGDVPCLVGGFEGVVRQEGVRKQRRTGLQPASIEWGTGAMTGCNWHCRALFRVGKVYACKKAYRGELEEQAGERMPGVIAAKRPPRAPGLLGEMQWGGGECCC